MQKHHQLLLTVRTLTATETPSKKHRSANMPDFPWNKKRKGTNSGEGQEQMGAYYSGFHTTITVYQQKGLTIIKNCCLDSGYTDFGCRALINPSAAAALDIEHFPNVRQAILADGRTSITERSMHVPLTFHTQSGMITIPAVVDIRARDSAANSMLLSTGVLAALRGTHDHSTSPSTFTVVNTYTGMREFLIGENVMPSATWIPKEEQTAYRNTIISTGAFQFANLHLFPPMALQRIGTSHDMYYWFADAAHTYSAATVLVNSIAAAERVHYKTLRDIWEADENEDKVGLGAIRRQVYEDFEPEPSPDYMPEYEGV